MTSDFLEIECSKRSRLNVIRRGRSNLPVKWFPGKEWLDTYNSPSDESLGDDNSSAYSEMASPSYRPYPE